MPNIALDYVIPSPALAAYVTLFYLFRADIDEFDDVERADHAQLRFRLSGGEGAYRFADGVEQAAPVSHFVGATGGAMRTRADGPLRVFGMGLTPAGWEALVGLDAAAAADRVIDAKSRLGGAAAGLAGALATCPTAEEMAAIAEPRLIALIGGSRQATLGFVRAVDTWLVACASPEIGTLVAATGLSRRQVERRCNQLYGAPPKLLSRKYRTLRAAVAMADGQDAPVEEAFYDQSHMIREIKQFTGLTPRTMRNAPGALARLTIERRRALEGQVPPIISDT